MLKNMDALFSSSIEVIELDSNELKPYHDHEFIHYSEEKINGLVGSIAEFGLIHPVIVRTYQGGYEILAGHNRNEACKRLDIKVPCIVHVDLSDEKAHAYVTETNVHQRGFEELSLSNRALIIKNYRDRYKKQGWRKDLLEGVDENDETLLTGDEAVQSEYNLSKSEISRLIRLHELIDGFKYLLDVGQLPKRVGVEISFISKDDQEAIHEYSVGRDKRISMKQAKELRSLSEDGMLSIQSMDTVFEPELTYDVEAYLNVESHLKGALDTKVKLKEKSLTIKFDSPKELVEILNKMNMSESTHFVSTGDEVE